MRIAALCLGTYECMLPPFQRCYAAIVGLVEAHETEIFTSKYTRNSTKGQISVNLFQGDRKVCIGRACAFPRIQTGRATFTASGFPYSLLLFFWPRSDTLMSAAQPVAWEPPLWRGTRTQYS